MTKKTAIIIIAALFVLGIGLTAAHLIYDFIAYQHSSIIYFIAKELW